MYDDVVVVAFSRPVKIETSEAGASQRGGGGGFLLHETPSPGGLAIFLYTNYSTTCETRSMHALLRPAQYKCTCMCI